MVFPVVRLFFRSPEEFKKQGRRAVSASFRFLICVMTVLDVARQETKDRNVFLNLSGKIVVANHPSLLDVVMLISLIPNADCIVNGYLLKHFLRPIVRQMYIPHSLDFDKLVGLCTESLEQGSCLIIFPQGTRTPRSGPISVKKGAARISLLSGKGIVPVRIGGNDKWGLGKKAPWTAFNHTGSYLYDIKMLDEIKPEKYAGLPMSIAVKRMNEEIKDVLFGPGERERVI
ncbi:MAG: 1-acyl-sn-glycerol-3-phosphate acyltransferase [Treponema sp.]|nr:1-acyl-sn-glycerol-3-phosphate acyltransferase [Treponema sp.]